MAGSYTIGGTIKLEGEKEYKKALADIKVSARALKSEMGLVTSEFDKNDKSEKALTAQNKVLTKSIAEQKNTIATLENALKNASEEFGENDKRTKKWATELNNAKAELNGLEKKLKENSESAKKSLINFEKIGGALKTVGKAMAGAATAVGASMAGAGAGIVALAKKTSDASAEINNMSQKVGMSVEGYQKWSYILSKSGADASLLKTGMKKLSDTVVKAGEGNQGAAEKFAKLGISMDELKGKSQEEIFERVVTGLQGMEEGAERTSLATSLLGKSAVELGPLLNKSSDEMQNLTGNLNKYGLVMGEDVVKANVAFKGSFSNFKRVISATANSLMSELVPGMAQVVNGFTDLIMGVDGADEQIKKGIENIANGVDSAIPKLVSMIQDIATKLLEVAPSILKTLGDALLTELPKLLPTITELILGLGRMIIEALPQLIECATQIILELAKGIAEALPTLVPTIVDVILKIAEVLIDNIDVIIEVALKLIIALAEGLFRALPKLIAKLPELLAKIVKALIKGLGVIGKVAFELVQKLGQGIVNFASNIGGNIAEFMGKVGDFFKNGLNAFLDIGKNIVKGLWDGICAMGDWIKNKIGEFVGGMVDGIKGLLGIHSPSKVFFGIGKNMALGLEQGFEKSLKDAKNSIKSAIPTEFTTDLNTSISTANPRQNAYGMRREDDLSTIFSEIKDMNDSMYDKFLVALINGVSISVDNREIARLIRRYA